MAPPPRTVGAVCLLWVVATTVAATACGAAGSGSGSGWGTTTVTTDHRAVIINGTRRLLVGGSIHYPRSTPSMWPGIMAKAKAGGLDFVEMSVPRHVLCCAVGSGVGVAAAGARCRCGWACV